jgi:hypothetical protein
MTTTEHLQLIKAECERLLAIAEKRTQGEWKLRPPTKDDLPVFCCRANGEMTAAGAATRNESSESNATFIAACAGRAEAGWRATIGVIDSILPYWEDALTDSSMCKTGCFSEWNLQAQPIILAWPIELLTNKQP